MTTRTEAPHPEHRTATTWEWQAIVPAAAALLEDAPVYESWLAHTAEDARRAAAEQGYQLDGDPQVSKEAGALVETKEGPVLMGMESARLCGYEGPATAYRHVFRFKAHRNG
jgi:hypothetical protein